MIYNIALCKKQGLITSFSFLFSLQNLNLKI